MKRTLAAGASWMTLLQLASKLIEVDFAAVFARPFGVIACAMIFIQFASMLVEIGSGTTIHLPNLTRDDARAASTLVFVNAVNYFLLAQLLAPAAGGFLDTADVTPVIRAFAPLILIQAVGIVPENLPVRKLGSGHRTGTDIR